METNSNDAAQKSMLAFLQSKGAMLVRLKEAAAKLRAGHSVVENEGAGGAIVVRVAHDAWVSLMAAQVALQALENFETRKN